MFIKYLTATCCLLLLPLTLTAATETAKPLDTDKDYLADDWEKILGTDSANPDSDGDKFLDGTEVAAGFDPLTAGNNKLEKLIEIDLKKQQLTYWFGGKQLAQFLISGGLKYLPTPRGQFTVLAKEDLRTYGGRGYNFYYPKTKWNLLFKRGTKLNYYIHGAYWHNKFGQPMSHGCVNVSYQNMERLYWFAQLGTRVVIK